MHKKFAAALLALGLCASSAWAIDTPTSSPLDRRLYTAEYNEDQVYPILAAPGLVSTIIFGKDEEVQMHTSGFSSAWEFAARGNHFFLKPKEPQGDTNLVVVTNKRTYHFVLNLQRQRGRTTYELRFVYPEEIAAKLKAEHDAKIVADRLSKSPLDAAKEGSGNASAVSAGDSAPALKAKQNRNYTMNFGKEKNSRRIAPVEAFDDNRFTYLRFARASDFPAVYRVVDDEETLVNSHVEGDWLVLHGVYEELHLRAGQGVVGVYNESYTGGSASVDDGVSVPGLKRKVLGSDI